MSMQGAQTSSPTVGGLGTQADQLERLQKLEREHQEMLGWVKLA